MNEPRRSSHPIARAVAIAILIAALTGAGYVALVQGPIHLLEGGEAVANKGLEDAYGQFKRFAKDVDKVLHFSPRISRGGTMIVEETIAIRELATVQRTFSDEYLWEHDFLGSTKRIKLGGDFIVKAGYDLTKPFTIDFSTDGGTVSIPRAKILSIEQRKERVLQDENGWWNKISAADREQVQNEFLKHARATVLKTDILAQADAKLTEQLEEILRQNRESGIKIIRQPSDQ